MEVKGLSRIKLIFLISAGAGLLIALILRIVSLSVISKVPGNKVAENWAKEGGYSHISAYFTPDAGVDADTLKYLHFQIEEKLNAESITTDEEYPNAKLTESCFAANGTITVSSQKANVTLNAVGVSGDYFNIHPQEMLSGVYFSDSDLNEDYCIIDRSAAWKLYGSPDIAGQILYVGDKPLVVRGVFDQPQDKLSFAAGARQDFCYVSYNYLKDNGTIYGVSSYDIVMPNPVPDYAMAKIKSNLSVNEDKIDLIENTKRFSILNSLKNLKGVFYRSMRTKAVVYPWWENVARNKADIVSVLTLFFVIMLSYAGLVVLTLAVILFIQNKDLIGHQFVRLYEWISSLIAYKKREEGL